MKFKKIIVFVLAGVLMMSLFGCNKSNNSKLTRADAAKIIAIKTNFSGGEDLALDVSDKDKNSSEIYACLSRNIFGEPTVSYNFQPKKQVTRYDLAKISIFTYAALMCVEDENLLSGDVRNITDIAKLSVEQRWYIHSALTYKFIDISGTAFEPDKAVTKSELEDCIDKVVAKAGVMGTDLNTYKSKKLDNFKTFPSNGAPLAELVDCFGVVGLNSFGNRLAVSSLQGLVNRDEIVLYLDYGGYKWMTDYAVEKEYFNGYKTELNSGDWIALFNRYSKYINKVIILDDDNPFSINTCVNIAAVEGRIIISEDMLQAVKSINPDVDIKKFTDLNLNSQLDSEKWCYANLFEYMRRDVIAWSYYSNQTDWTRDYPIQMKVPTMWVAGNNSDDYDENGMIFASEVLQRYPANIPMLGFGYAYDPAINGNVGIGEYEGVKFHGEYGKYTAVFDTVGNLSFHTAIPVDAAKKHFKSKVKDALTFDSDKKYVAVTMMESGDSPAYIQYGMKDRQWDDAARGEVPYNFSYGLNNYDLYPMLTEYWFETSKPYDYFFGAISGLGYSYPLIGFGDKGVRNEEGLFMDKAAIMKDHYTKANILSKKLGFDSLGVYSFSEGAWNEYHYEEFDENVLQYMPDIKTIMADMHRGVFQLPKEKLMHTSKFGQRIYHCSTKWSLTDFANQTDANDYLYNEILRTTSNGGTFFQCMAYSWHYGPDDIKAVIDRFKTEKPEYQFVTIDQLDELYLASQK